MTRQEAGRKGGLKVARERGPEFYRKIGKKGGEKVSAQRGAEFFRAIGRRGGENRNKRATGTKDTTGQERHRHASQSTSQKTSTPNSPHSSKR